MSPTSLFYCKLQHGRDATVVLSHSTPTERLKTEWPIKKVANIKKKKIRIV